MKREFFLSFIAFLSISFNIFSQNLSTTDQPQLAPANKELGFFVGLGNNMQIGDFKTSCNCIFDNGLKFGFTLGALYEQEINKSFTFGGMISYDNRNIKALYSQYVNTDVKSTTTQKTENIPILFRFISNADFHNINITPFIKFLPFKYTFIRIGFEAGINISNHLLFQEELIQTTARLSTGEVTQVNFQGTTKTIMNIDDSEFPETKTMIFGLNAAIGGNIPLNKKVTLSPIVSYSLPLSKFSENRNDFKVSAFRGILEIRILMNNRSEK